MACISQCIVFVETQFYSENRFTSPRLRGPEDKLKLRKQMHSAIFIIFLRGSILEVSVGLQGSTGGCSSFVRC